MQLVEKHVIKQTHPNFDEIDAAAFASKNLYNAGNYILRQRFINEGKYTGAKSKRIDRLTDKRNRKIDDYLHKASRRIVDHLVAHRIGVLVVGKNNGQKQKINIGKRNNQNFVQVPHTRFIEMLKYKCALVGIKVHTPEESYTSKTSFLDRELPEKQETYSGRRIKRGLFRASDGTKLNADINGAAQIIRKVFPNAFDADGIEGVAVRPLRWNISVA